LVIAGNDQAKCNVISKNKPYADCILLLRLFIFQIVVNECLKVIMSDILPLRIIKMDYEDVFFHSGMDFQSYFVILFWEVSELMS